MSGKRISLDSIVRDVASKHILTHKESRVIVRGIFSLIRQTMVEGDSVHIPNFGIFYAATKPAGMVMNPRDGVMVYRDSREVPKVRFSTGVLRKDDEK